MNFSQLKEIFPEAQHCDHPASDSQSLSFFSEGKWIVLPQKDLTQRERRLLDVLYQQMNHQSPWFELLILGKQTTQDLNQAYTIIQFNAEGISDRDQWLHILSSYFESIEDAFFVTPTYGLLVHKGICTLDLTQFEAMINPLNEDFETNASFYIGMPLTHDLYHLFKHEQDLFLKHGKKTSNFLNLYQEAVIKPSLLNDPIGQEIRSLILSSQDLIPLIKTLWETKGNISSSANLLYLHRNTLNYRIDRFYEQTGLNLRNLDNLLLCYLLIK